MIRRRSDSDWGPEHDSGSAIQSDHFPNSVGPNKPEYTVTFVETAAQDLFGPGTMPFIADAGSRKIYLADEGSMHVSIMAELDGQPLIGPLIRGYIEFRNGRVHLDTNNQDEIEPIEKALGDYTGTSDVKFGGVKTDKAVCPACDELLSECECFKWGEGAEWNDEPIDQSSLREMKPGIQASRKTALTMYHVAPTSVRESIQERGLTGHERGYDDDHLPSMWNYNWDQPSGNYFFPNRHDAYTYINALRQNGKVDKNEIFDVYSVDVDGLPVYPDPEDMLTGGQTNLGDVWSLQNDYDENEDPEDVRPSPATAVTPVRVSPERLRLIDGGVPDGPDAEYVIDQSDWDEDKLNEMRGWTQLPMTAIPWPGHEAKLSPQQKAAAWDKPTDALRPEEAAYVLDQ